MKMKNQILFLTVLALLICCVSAASAVDIDSTDDVADEIAIDEVSDVIEDVSVDDVEEEVINEEVIDAEFIGADSSDDDYKIVDENSRVYARYFEVNSSNVGDYFNTSTGEVLNSFNLNFTGTFNNVPFDNFIFPRYINLDFTDAVFENVGFRLLRSGMTINGATFTCTQSATNEACIYVGAENTTIKNSNFNINAPSNADYYAINVFNGTNALILNNTIDYLCNYSNPDNYNYAIKVKNSSSVKVVGNNITASLPLKTVKHYIPGIEGLDKDFVAGVGVSDSEYFNFTKNTVDVTVNYRVIEYPTLDALIIWYSNNSSIRDNMFSVKDPKTATNQSSYIYGVDLYKSDNVTVHNNTINMNADQSGGYIGGNGTGAAYCVQLTGPYTGVTVSGNTLITKNNGPNAAIYSQNWDGPTNLTVNGNVIYVTGKGTDINWDVLSGMELQDTYATVTGNYITVTNLGSFSTGYNVYGISYCQYTPDSHNYTINNNVIDVFKGRYTIYLLNGSINSISSNSLHAFDGSTNYYGTSTIKTNG